MQSDNAGLWLDPAALEPTDEVVPCLSCNSGSAHCSKTECIFAPLDFTLEQAPQTKTTQAAQKKVEKLGDLEEKAQAAIQQE